MQYSARCCCSAGHNAASPLYDATTGVFAEILDDKILRVAPLCEGESAAMARDLKGFPVLDGARGRPPADIAALADILERLAALALAVPEIEEIDINP